MVIAGILFCVGMLVGLSYHYVVIILVSILTVIAMSLLWLALGQFQAFSLLILLGYLFALQSGYLLAAYLRAGRDLDTAAGNEPSERGSPEQDDAARSEAQPRPPAYRQRERKHDERQ